MRYNAFHLDMPYNLQQHGGVTWAEDKSKGLGLLKDSISGGFSSGKCII